MKPKRILKNVTATKSEELKVEYDMLVHSLGERHLQLDIIIKEIEQLKTKINEVCTQFTKSSKLS